MDIIKPQYKHSKIGQLCFDISAKVTKFIIKHRWLYYLLSFTWNIIMTLLGLIITVVLYVLVEPARPFKYYWIYYLKVGPAYWGGFDTGLMFVRDQDSSDSLNEHEWGHSLSQGIWLGPLFIFVVAIPSAIRWWLRAIFKKKKWPDYSSVWFEDAASQCGKYAVKYIDYITTVKAR